MDTDDVAGADAVTCIVSALLWAGVHHPPTLLRGTQNKEPVGVRTPHRRKYYAVSQK